MRRRLPAVLLMLAALAIPVAGQEPSAPAPATSLFWEPLREVARGSAASPITNVLAASGGGLLAAGWQERVADPRDPLGGQLRAMITTSRDGLAWSRPHAVGTPVALTNVQPGSEPFITALAVDGSGRLASAMLGQDDRVILLLSTDAGATFTEVGRLSAGSSVTSLSLSVTRDGRFLLLVTRARADGFAIAFSRSEVGGKDWSPLSDLFSDAQLAFNFQETHAVIGDRDYVVFSSRYEPQQGAYTFQLWLTWSEDGGRTWQAPVDVTDKPAFREAVAGQARSPAEFNNYRASIGDVGGKVGLAWERQHLSVNRPQVYYCELDRDGRLVTPPQKISSAVGGAQFARLFQWNGVPWLAFVEQTDRPRLVLAAHRQLWEPEASVASRSEDARFPQLAMMDGHPYLFWERDGSLVRLSPDISTLPPILTAQGFTPGQPANRSDLRVTVRPPQDSSGIAELRYQWGPAEAGAPEVTVPPAGATLQLQASEDGQWSLSVRAVDRAGNVSAPATLSYVRDTVPPPPVELAVEPGEDADGYLPSNSYRVRWAEPTGEAVKGYVVATVTLSDNPAASVAEPVVSLAGRPLQQTAGLAVSNADNGVRAVVVAAEDVAGNLSPASVLLLRLRRYVPVTYIGRLSSTLDQQEQAHFTIVGRGFSVGGKVAEVYLDRDRREPYDYTFEPGRFTVVDDRHIDGPTLDATIDSGSYWVGVRQPTRPTAWAAAPVAWDSPGTVKFGSFSFRWSPRWVVTGPSRLIGRVVPFSSVVLFLLIAMLAILAALTGQRLGVVVREGAMLRQEALALLDGRPSPALVVEREKQMKELVRRGIGLRLKFSALIVVLVVAIVAIVALRLASQMIEREQGILAQGLDSRVKMLMQDAANRAAEQFPLGAAGATGMVEVPDAIRTMPNEAVSMTVTGPQGRVAIAAAPEGDRDYVWASNAPGPWAEQYARGQFVPGEVAVDDEISREILSDYVKEVNGKVRADAVLVGNIDRYYQTQASLEALGASLVSRGRDPNADAGYAGTKKSSDNLRVQINQSLRTIASEMVRSLPSFPASGAGLEPSYLFYQPILALSSSMVGGRRQPSSFYYVGLVRVELSTQVARSEIAKAQSDLITTTLLAALAAVALGVLGAIVLATITIRPIKRLASGVAVIRDTEDKKELRNHVIKVRSRDEIGTLAATVNEMTQGLVKAAIANADLILGKDVQKMFLPLDKDRAGRKGSTFGLDTKDLEVFGYYEGAAEVSGDFFDFRQLDATHHAFIKCDVSGHGVSAGLIMVEVATLYISWCRDWRRRKESLGQVRDAGERQRILRELNRLDTLVYTINDMIEERGFKGLFAAFTLGIIDTATGAVTACPAGDNEVTTYDASERRVVHSQFTQGSGSPAAGTFPSMLIETKSGFPQFGVQLDHGDILFLPTDGIDEAVRFRRDRAFRIIKAEQQLPTGGTRLVEQTEAFGKERMDRIITGVFARRRESLVREDNPVADERLEFDFSSCEGTVREAVLAVMSAEKLFRLVPMPTAGETNRVAVDAKIDAFLKQHFLQYDRYFAHRLEGPPDDPYARFSHLVEDEQRDDLTILVVRRK